MKTLHQKTSLNSMIVSSLALVATADLASAANLLVDPGFETQATLPSYAAVVSSLSGNQGTWGAESGYFTTSENSVNPVGSRMLGMTDDGLSVTQAIQITSLSAFAAEIANGTATFDMSAIFDTTSIANGATGAIAARFYSSDSFSSEIAVFSNSLALNNSQSTFEPILLSGTIPTNAAWIGTEVLFNNDSLNGSVGYVENASLTVIPEPSSVLLSALAGALCLFRRKRTS